eukprot:11574116-Alexandrium_andersonii.AAC.1
MPAPGLPVPPPAAQAGLGGLLGSLRSPVAAAPAGLPPLGPAPVVARALGAAPALGRWRVADSSVPGLPLGQEW